MILRIIRLVINPKTSYYYGSEDQIKAQINGPEYFLIVKRLGPWRYVIEIFDGPPCARHKPETVYQHTFYWLALLHCNRIIKEYRKLFKLVFVVQITENDLPEKSAFKTH